MKDITSIEMESNRILTVDLLQLPKFATDFLSSVPALCPFCKGSVLAVLLQEGQILQKWILSILSLKVIVGNLIEASIALETVYTKV